jgi:hypothetical protein
MWEESLKMPEETYNELVSKIYKAQTAYEGLITTGVIEGKNSKTMKNQIEAIQQKTSKPQPINKFAGVHKNVMQQASRKLHTLLHKRPIPTPKEMNNNMRRAQEDPDIRKVLVAMGKLNEKK